MKKFVPLIFVLFVLVSLFGCSTNSVNTSDNTVQPPSTNTSTSPDLQTGDSTGVVTQLIEDFGKKLQQVSLLSDTAGSSMQENYGPYVDAKLLAKWQADPQNAPGRLVSSPWPDRIEVQSVDKLSDTSYIVKGEIIEVTSTEAETGAAAARRVITLTVSYNSKTWLITDVTLGDYVAGTSITYVNDNYGFTFTLPISWQGYTLIESTWNGMDVASGKQTETGPLLSIRHPGWTQDTPRQDIPIMIFTLAQWDAVKNETLSVSAAPIPPRELGRNSTYVFTLPARYNYAFPEGYQEVEDIIAGEPLNPTETINTAPAK